MAVLFNDGLQNLNPNICMLDQTSISTLKTNYWTLHIQIGTLLLWSTFCDVYRYHLLKYKTQSQRGTTHERTKICDLTRQLDCWDFWIPAHFAWKHPIRIIFRQLEKDQASQHSHQRKRLSCNRTCDFANDGGCSMDSARIAVSVYNISLLK